MIPARRTALALLLALATILLSACGGSKSPSSAQDILKDTFGPGKPVRSGDLDLALALNATGLQGVNGPVKVTLKGPFQSQGGTSLPAFAFDLGLTSGGTTFTAGAVSTSDAGYLKFQGTSYALPPALFASFKKGYEASAKGSGKKSSGTSLRALGVDPLRWLRSPRKVGTEDVGGTSTQHVTATVDVPALLTDVDKLLAKAGTLSAGQSAAKVPQRLTPTQRKQITDAVKSASFDVWAGKDDGTLRKLDVKIAFDVPKAGQAASRGLRKGTLQITLTIADLNKKQTITGPKTSRPLSELQAQVGALLGAATGSTGTGAPGTTTPDAPGTAPAPAAPAAPSAADSAYIQCLKAAGTEIAKVNACAKLLNK